MQGAKLSTYFTWSLLTVCLLCIKLKCLISSGRRMWNWMSCCSGWSTHLAHWPRHRLEAGDRLQLGQWVILSTLPKLHIRSQAWEECRLRGDEDPSSWQGYNHAGGFCFIIHACIILLCCNVVSGNLPFCRHYNPTITRSRPVASRASNVHSRRFHNHGEGQHFTLLTFKRLLAIKTKWAPHNGQVALSIFIFISSVSASWFHIYIHTVC